MSFLKLKPGDLKWQERTGTSCQIKIHFWVTKIRYLLKYTLFPFQIHIRATILMTKHNHKISTRFIKNNRRYNRLNTTKWISISTTLLSADWLKIWRRDHLELVSTFIQLSIEFFHPKGQGYTPDACMDSWNV